MSDRKAGQPGNPEDPAPDQEPQVLALKRNDIFWRMGKRTFLKTAAAGAVGGATVGCSDPPKDPDNAIPPFTVGGTTYRLMDLKDYNGLLPASGTNLAVVGYVQNDFYFRYFDDQQRQTVNHHESRIEDKPAVSELKTLATSLAAKGNAADAEQTRFAELFTAVRSDVAKTEQSSRRRMQGSKGRVEARGRRMQGSASHGSVSGKRMQGAEGRVEAGAPQRNLGVLIINSQRYNESRIEETYGDGYTKIAHAGGSILVRTDALPEMVRLQLPHPVSASSDRPSAIPRTHTETRKERTETVVPAPVAPSPPPRPPRPAPPSGADHYWRPN